MADKFFQDDEVVEEQPQETLKLGEKEYSMDDLNRLVGLGEMAAEASEKYKTPIDRVYPEFTKAAQKNSDLQRQLDELKQAQIQPQTQPVDQSMQLTAEQKELARKQLADLGFSQDTYRQIVREELAADKLVSDINNLIEDAKANGQPVTSDRELLQYMAETGIKNPQKAYKDMFEDELDAIKEKKLAEIKPQGMITTNGSQAGGKQPAPVKITRANLTSLVQQALGGE